MARIAEDLLLLLLDNTSTQPCLDKPRRERILPAAVLLDLAHACLIRPAVDGDPAPAGRLIALTRRGPLDPVAEPAFRLLQRRALRPLSAIDKLRGHTEAALLNHLAGTGQIGRVELAGKRIGHNYGWPVANRDRAAHSRSLQASQEAFVSANMAFNMYQGLTHGAYSAILVHGTEEQKAKWLPKLVTCDWTGTMNLTEPHCGTDLRLMKTKAVEQPDGTYKLSGTKIFISGGDQDLTENIIHMVIAKIPDENGKTSDDLSTVNFFMVPKFLVNEDGTMGARNGVFTGSIEKKMGIYSKFLPSQYKTDRRCSLRSLSDTERKASVRGISNPCLSRSNASKR